MQIKDKYQSTGYRKNKQKRAEDSIIQKKTHFYELSAMENHLMLVLIFKRIVEKQGIE